MTPTFVHPSRTISAIQTGLPTISESSDEPPIETGGAVDVEDQANPQRDSADGGGRHNGTPKVPDGIITSKGSAKHPNCVPCIFMALNAGGAKLTACSAGAGCEYCHFSHPMTKKDLLKRLRNQTRVAGENAPRGICISEI